MDSIFVFIPQGFALSSLLSGRFDAGRVDESRVTIQRGSQYVYVDALSRSDWEGDTEDRAVLDFAGAELKGTWAAIGLSYHRDSEELARAIIEVLATERAMVFATDSNPAVLLTSAQVLSEMRRELRKSMLDWRMVT